MPNLVVIGAMKAGTSALHRYLGMHPEIAMSEPKELNFFFGRPGVSSNGASRSREGPEQGQGPFAGNWRRGPAWYAQHFPAECAVRGESSPGYTSPSFPEVAPRMARMIPDARLVYLVRDPIDRAISQYRHHYAEGTENRPVEEAILDPRSQYVSRGRYYERLLPFLQCFERCQIAIAAREELLTARRATLRHLFGWLGIDENFWSSDLGREWRASNGSRPHVGSAVRGALVEAFAGDVARLREVAGRDFPEWSL
jgi:hypothetical protein